MNSMSGGTRRAALVAAVGLVGTGAVATIASARSSASIGTGVVLIDTQLGYQSGAAAGTGMVLTSSGTVLTNNHVIARATSIRVSIPGTGRSYPAHVVGYAMTRDVAVIKLDGASNLKTVSPSGAKVTLNQRVTAVGNAGGRGVLSTASGRVTGTGRSITAGDDSGSSERLTDLIETNAGVEPGDSGGPLLDSASGKVVGMTTAASSGGGGYGYTQTSASDAYAIPIGNALNLAQAILSGKSSAIVHIGDTAFLGVSVSDADGGAGIVSTVSGGPADSAGLGAGDVVTSLNGRAVRSASQPTTVMLSQKAGARVSVTYLDQLGSHTTTVRLGSGPAQ